MNTDRYHYLGTFEVIFGLSSVSSGKEFSGISKMSFYGIFLQIRKYVEIYTAIKVKLLKVEREYIGFEIDFFITS